MLLCTCPSFKTLAFRGLCSSNKYKGCAKLKKIHTTDIEFLLRILSYLRLSLTLWFKRKKNLLMGTCEYPKCRKAGKTDHTYKAFSAVLLNMKFRSRSSVAQVPASPDGEFHPDGESCSLGITAGTVGSTPVPPKQGAAVQGCSKQLLLPSSRGRKWTKLWGLSHSLAL